MDWAFLFLICFLVTIGLNETWKAATINVNLPTTWARTYSYSSRRTLDLSKVEICRYSPVIDNYSSMVRNWREPYNTWYFLKLWSLYVLSYKLWVTSKNIFIRLFKNYIDKWRALMVHRPFRPNNYLLNSSFIGCYWTQVLLILLLRYRWCLPIQTHIITNWSYHLYTYCLLWILEDPNLKPIEQHKVSGLFAC